MAIAKDTSTDLGVAFATSLTTAHTCTGSDLILFVGGWGNVNVDNWTGVTYNGVAMTRVNAVIYYGNSRYDYIYALLNPATGTHNVVISASDSGGISANATSFTGVDQATSVSSLPQTTGNGTNSTSTSLSVTAAYDNSNAYGMMHGMGTAGTNTTKDSGNNGQAGYHRTTNLTPAGTLTLAWTNGGATDFGCNLVAFGPVQPNLANVKTINGLAKASVKTINGLAIASVKSWNGLS